MKVHLPLSVQPSMVLAFLTAQGRCGFELASLSQGPTVLCNSAALQPVESHNTNKVCATVFWLRWPFLKQTEILELYDH